MKVVTLCGGVALRGQTVSLEHGADVVVGTPGRILDHLERGSLSLAGVNTLVLDEADRMLDMGFFDDIAKVVRQCAKDRQTLLVVELKRGRASDVVVGQIQRYMGYVLAELATEEQIVRGAIIALEDDLKLRRALSVTTNIDFYRYQVSFKLLPG